MYNSEDDLIKHLFETIISSVSGAENETNRKNLTKTIGKYFLHFLKGFKIDARLGNPLTGQVGAAYDMKNFTEAIEKDLFKEETIYDVKNQINDVLKSLANPIVIFIDDIDRLSKSEVYILFKTIRLIADFKNIIYLLSFDDEMVAKSIKSNFADGTENDGFYYLEKIIDINLRLPDVSKSKLNVFFKNLFEKMVEEKVVHYDDIFKIISDRLIATPRDCLRVANSVTMMYQYLNKEIELLDLIALETIRLKNRSLFDLIWKYHKIHESSDPNFVKNDFDFTLLLGKSLGFDGITNVKISDNSILKEINFLFVFLLKVDIFYNFFASYYDNGEVKYRKRGNDLIFFKDFYKELSDNSYRISNPKILKRYFESVEILD